MDLHRSETSQKLRFGNVTNWELEARKMGGVPHLAAGNAFLPSQKLPLQVKEQEEDEGGKTCLTGFEEEKLVGCLDIEHSNCWNPFLIMISKIETKICL